MKVTAKIQNLVLYELFSCAGRIFGADEEASRRSNTICPLDGPWESRTPKRGAGRVPGEQRKVVFGSRTPVERASVGCGDRRGGLAGLQQGQEGVDGGFFVVFAHDGVDVGLDVRLVQRAEGQGFGLEAAGRGGNQGDAQSGHDQA